MAPSYRRTKQSKGHIRRSQVVYHRPRKIKTIIYLLLCVIVVIGGLYSGYTILSNINSGGIDVNVVKNQELSIHFLELGNKSTGDCTFIKAGNTDILIDAGSTAGSIPTIENYLNQYVEDNKLEYVIVTHAHEDHYAGFATSENKESLFDIYNVETVIHFAQVEAGKAETVMYLNFQRELNELKTRCGAEVYTAKECVDNVNGAKKIYDIEKKHSVRDS
ncbi:MAG: MBL fold metallo-hydrolase [Clostridia bacterium]|nr:MBL fold metallo-hydrolase [Clostridia bacterium]